MNTAAVYEACRRFRVGDLTRRARGISGVRPTTGAGASVEFHDFRPYAPGDDLRRVDWAVFGRTGELTLRRYREELHPRCDVVLDGSRSMQIDDGRKAALARELGAFFFESSQAAGAAARMHEWGAALEPRLDAESIRFDADHSGLFSSPHPPQLRGRGLRVLLSDFMNPRVPTGLLRRLALDAAALVVIRVIGPWEAAPQATQQWLLRDSESADEMALGLSRDAVERYRRRLDAIRDTLIRHCAAVGAHFVDVVGDTTIDAALIRDFAPREVVVPR